MPRRATTGVSTGDAEKGLLPAVGAVENVEAAAAPCLGGIGDDVNSSDD